MQIIKNRVCLAKGTQLKKGFSGWILILPSMLLFIYTAWRPELIGAVYSLFDLKGFMPAEFVGLKNYYDVLSDTTFKTLLLNTLKYVGWSFILGFPFPLITAVILNEVVHGKRFLKLSIYFPVIIPGIAASLIWYFIYFPGTSGLFNIILSWFGAGPFQWLQDKRATIPLIVLSISWKSSGQALIIYLAALQGICKEQYEAARLDGAGLWGRIRHIMLPRLSGIILLMAVKQMIDVFQVLEQPLAMTGGGPNHASATLTLQSYRYAFMYYQNARALALNMITFFILFVFTLILLKKFIKRVPK